MSRRVRLRASGLVLGALVLLAACSADPEPTATAAPSTTPSPIRSPSPSPTPLPTDERSAVPSMAVGGAYLALGDSVTFGIGVPQPQRNGFPARVADRLRTADPAISETRVFAVPGETASGFLARRLDDVRAAIRELGPRVELVTIGLGANELLRAGRAAPCEADPSSAACTTVVDDAVTDATEALDAVVVAVRDALAAEGSDARILVLAYYNPDVEPTAATAIVGVDGLVSCVDSEPEPGLNDRIACVAAEREVELIDLYAAFLGREAELIRIGAGDVHPNDAGYGVIADAIVAAVEGAP